MNQKLIISTILCTLIILCFTLSAVAQTGERNKNPELSKKSVESGYMINSGPAYFLSTGIDLLPGPETTSARFQIITGYQFNAKFSAAFGTGFTFYNDPLSLIPLFLNSRMRLSEGNVMPFIDLKAGYNISILTNTDTFVQQNRGGFLLNPAIGLEFETMSGFDWQITAGFNIDHSQHSREGFSGQIIRTDITYRRFMAGMGFSL
jgi:hypothetical protein